MTVRNTSIFSVVAHATEKRSKIGDHAQTTSFDLRLQLLQFLIVQIDPPSAMNGSGKPCNVVRLGWLFLFDCPLGTEELGHLEMIAAIVHQLTRNLTEDQLENNPGFAAYFVDHTTGIYPTAASGFPWNAASMAVKGDPICDLTEDLAAEAALSHQLSGQKTLENQGFFVARAFSSCTFIRTTRLLLIGQATFQGTKNAPLSTVEHFPICQRTFQIPSFPV